MRSSSVLLVNASALAIGLVGITPAFGQVSGPPETVVPAQAQEDALDEEPGTDDEPVARDADGSEAQGGTITVTGSRIRLPNLESFEPTTTLDSRQVRERNFQNVADALNELPGFRGSVTPAGAQGSFGQGVNFVNNYGLGSNRTLTLVNGRRFVSSNVASLFNQGSQGTQVDLNVIPTILLDRIDTVSTGGAPVYGSDAIAGTVNIILRSQYDGIEITGFTGITEEGDNFRFNVSGLAGWNFGERANVTVAISHDDVEGVRLQQRDFLRYSVFPVTNPSAAQIPGLGRPAGTTAANDGRVNPFIGFNNTTTDLTPGAVLISRRQIGFLTRGGLISAGGSAANTLQFDSEGNLVPFNQGICFPGIDCQGGEGLNLQEFGQITTDLRRTIANVFFTFDVTDNVELFLEGTHFRSRADELLQQPTFNSSLFGGTSAALTFDRNNPFVTPQARAQLQARNVQTFQVSRGSGDLADLTGFNETTIYRFVGGLRGDFSLFGRDMNWEVYGNWGQTNSTDFGQDVNAQNFINAVNVTTNAQGQIVCTTAPTRLVGATLTGFAAPGGTPIADPNCVPLNLLGENRSSQAARDYVIEDTITRSRQEQTVYSANLGGTLFDIWGGAVGFNIGYEHRDEFARFQPNSFQTEGRGRSAAVAPLQGRYNLDEVFGEILLPLVSPETGLSFIQSAQVFGRGRYVHNTVNGGFFAYAFGGSIAPIEDIEFRGNFTRSFRSPAITELFLPISPGFNFVNDLCSPANIGGGPAPAIRTRNCNAFLAKFPGATPLQAASASVPSLSGGNPTLDNEQANSWTAGVIVRPRFLPGFSATADYVSITLNDPIANLTSAQIVAGCFDNPDFNLDDPANGNTFCSRIRRDANGQVPADPANPAVTTGFVNGESIKFRGIQGTVNYSLPIDRWGMNGTFTVGGDMLYVRSRVVNITGVAPARSDGIIGDPEWSGQLRLRYVEDTWGTNTTINYIGEQLFSRTNRAIGPSSGPDAREIDELDDYVLVNSSIWFDPTENFRMTLGVNNIFNRQYQRYFDSYIPQSLSDNLGRRFTASARVRF
ncbi:MAG TPA: TonB-dependent receptor [Allosphingosinicella sp.]|jgi:outer membrane receptor protein involved in Fe transport